MDAYSTYKEHRVMTASPGRLVVMLYDGAVRFCKQAVTQLEQGRIAEKGQSIARAIDIIQELDVSLNLEQGGQVARDLRRLYEFMLKRLVQANLRQDPEMIREVIRLLEELAEGWRAIAG